jgi:hypothetical protein
MMSSGRVTGPETPDVGQLGARLGEGTAVGIGVGIPGLGVGGFASSTLTPGMTTRSQPGSM